MPLPKMGLPNRRRNVEARQQAVCPGLPHFAPKAKRVIYLFQSGGPSQLELFDHKPQLEKFRGQDLPGFHTPWPAADGDDGSSDTTSRLRLRSTSSLSTANPALL